MTLLVRDEEDIVEDHLSFHLSHEVDHVIVTDNRSVDATPEILAAFARKGVVTVINEPGDDYSQARWVTRMARLAAAELEADWVINSDADEFWMPPSGSLKEHLANVGDEVGALIVPRHDFVPLAGSGRRGIEGMVYRAVISTNPLGEPLPPKCPHRGYADVVVEQGNHEISVPRAISAPAAGIEIHHFPVRSFEQLARKIENGGRAYQRNTELPLEVGHAWRQLYEDLQRGTLRDYYDARVRTVDEAERAVANGELLIDPRVHTWPRLNRARMAALPTEARSRSSARWRRPGRAASPSTGS